MTAGSGPRDGRCLRVTHLFPELLSVYGDTGNLRTITVRAGRRGIEVMLSLVGAGSGSIPATDLFLIGGGQDREQITVGRELERVGGAIRSQIEDGAALLAICGGYQMLGSSYRTLDGATIEGAGIFPIETVAATRRMVGPVVADLDAWPEIAQARPTVVGFENHAGRTTLAAGARALATVEIGAGNNGIDRTEGILALPGADGLAGLRVGTYLHGPLLPRNPHLADALIAAGIARGGAPATLTAIDDLEEWRAHDRFVDRLRAARRRRERLPTRLRRVVDPVRGLIGF